MEAQLEKLRREVETGLGGPIDVGEEIEMKELFYFAKGVELKNELDRQDRSRRSGRIISAIGDFMRSPRSRAKRRSKERKPS